MILPLSVYAQWVKHDVKTTASLRGLSVVNEKVIWASGTGGTVIRTIDGGKTWNVMTVPAAEKLDFRDIEAFDASTAYILSIGNGEDSRIYKTVDGGKNWTEQFRNKDPKAFFDAIACTGRDSCFAMSDPVRGSYPIIGTLDGGAHWQYWSVESRPIEGEAAFAASGTCLIATRGELIIVSGGTRASIYKMTLAESSGRFERYATPMVSGSAGSGIFSIAMRDAGNGVIVGGNYEKPNHAENNLAFTTDAGKTWALGKGLTGYRSGVTYVDAKTLLAVGTNGSDISRDGGKTWLQLDGANYNSVQARGNRAIWAVGPSGYTARLDWQAFLAINGFQPCPKKMICDGPGMTDLRLSHNEIDACVKADLDCRKRQQIDVSAIAVNIPQSWYVYTVSGGQVIGFGSNVKWDLSDEKPGTYTITAGIKTPNGDSFQVFGRLVTRTVVIK